MKPRPWPLRLCPLRARRFADPEFARSGTRTNDTTSDGAPDGPTPCPNIAPYTWQYVEIGTDLPEDGFAIYDGNLARFSAGTPASQYTFSFPEGTPAGYYFVEVNCTAYQQGAPPIDYGYLDYAHVKVGHPEANTSQTALAMPFDLSTAWLTASPPRPSAHLPHRSKTGLVPPAD